MTGSHPHGAVLHGVVEPPAHRAGSGVARRAGPVVAGRRVEDADFAAFVEQHYARLLRTADLLTGDRGRAEDILQTVLARAYTRWPRIRQAEPIGYVRRALANAHADWWRRRSSWERPVASPPEPPAHVADPATHVVRRDAVLRALAPLTRRERTVVVLRYYEDLTVPEIAAVLRLPLGTVKSHCSRALGKLRISPDLTDLDTHRSTTRPDTEDPT